MGRIQSSVGLITGIPINDTIDQLMAISARPRDLLIDRNESLRAERLAITELTALVIGVQFSVERLGSEDLFQEKQISSSDESIITASTTGKPAAGSYEFTPVRKAQLHQLLSKGFKASDEPLGGGEVSFRFGGFLNQGRLLDELNQGDGVERGRIRITDRSGSSAEVDLRFSLTLDDVVDAINRTSDINVTASVEGDRLRLTDRTGQTVSNLKVQEIGLGTTASDLGLANVDTAATGVLGNDILQLYDDLSLASLNDGNGVAFGRGAADLEVTFRDGSSPLQIEFFAETKGPTVSSATLEGANGVNAGVTFTSVGTGEEWDGYDIVFEDDEDVTSGNEKVEVDQLTKEIRFTIDAGSTRAIHLVNALNNDSEASQLFTAGLPAGSDGTGVIDVADKATTSGGAIEYADEESLGEVLATINAADPARLQARISSSGDRIELVDLTSGSGTFSVNSLFGGSAAEDLGLTTTASAGVITGRRRLSGLSTVLLDSLAGGYGLGTLGALSLTDRSGATANVDLSAAETLDDVITAINGAGLGITARVNNARNGLQLDDSSGGTGNLIIASGDATNTADRLRITLDDAVSTSNSGSLDLRTVGAQTSLEAFNNGRGVTPGSFLITDSNGQVGAINLRVADAETVGDVIDLINGLSIDVQARINDTGDGILLLDTAGGAGTLTVADVGSGTAASDLKLSGPAVTQDIGGTPTQVIDGAQTLRITLDADDTLTDLVQKINDADGDVSASLFNSGSGTKPFRLSLASQITGSAGEILVDGTSLGVKFQELVAAEDALLMVGPADAPVAGALVVSNSNEFDKLIDGVTINVHSTSSEPVTIDITQTEEPIVSAINLFIEQYNSLVDKLEELTFFDSIENSAGILFGSVEALRIEFDLTNVMTSRFFGAGSIESLEEIGLSLDDKGKLSLNSDKFKDKYTANADAIERFFTEDDFGVAAKFKRVAEQLAGEENSLLLSRTQSLATNIENNDSRIAGFERALAAERESLQLEFFRLETVIGRLQNNLSAVSQIQGIPPLVSLNGAR